MPESPRLAILAAQVQSMQGPGVRCGLLRVMCKCLDTKFEAHRLALLAYEVCLEWQPLCSVAARKRRTAQAASVIESHRW